MVSDLNIFVWKLSKNCCAKKSFFCWFCLTKHGGSHASWWIRDLWSKGVSLILAYLLTFLSFCVLDDFFHFSKKLGFWVSLVHPESTLLDGLETSGWRVYRLFWHISRHFWVFAFWMSFSVFQKKWILGYSWSTLLWHRCYYPHRSRDALSPVCGIFSSSFWSVQTLSSPGPQLFSFKHSVPHQEYSLCDYRNIPLWIYTPFLS